jgi:hypothetical protein
MSVSINPDIVTDGLVLCLDAGNSASYPGSGTLWTDLSGNSNNGTLTNGPTFSSANKGSIVFDGTNDYIIGNSTLANGLLSGLTFSIWVKMNALVSMGLCVNFNSAGSQAGFSFLLTATSIDILYFTNGANYIGRTATITPNTNIWYNITATWNGVINNNGFSIYLYNSKVDNSNSSGGTVSSVINGGANFEIGRERYFAGPTNYLNGNITQVSIYNRPLSVSEISQNYNATKGRFGL